MASCSIRRSASAALIVLILATCGVLGATQASHPAPPKEIKRVVPVTNIVPTGASPIKNPVVRVEVIDAVDVRTSTGNWRTKFALRIKNVRGDRVRCSLKLMFDGEAVDQPGTIDLVQGGVDLDIYADYGGDGKRSDQLSRLTAEARDIRIGE